jgi:hypothetical protein
MNITIMAHVLENIVDPLEALSHIHEALDDSGLLVIEMPNPIYAPAVSIYHPHVYSRRAILHLMRRAGFSIIKYETSGRPVNAVLPRFQRVLASKIEAADVNLARPRAGIVPFSIRRRIGRFFWNKSNAFSLKPEFDSVDKLILDDVERSVENCPCA